MPKITAPTVAEHRENQHQLILDAALEAIVESHGSVPTVGEVAKRVGLARSSVYQYVSSKTELVAQLLTRFMRRWEAGVGQAMAQAGKDPRARLEAYVESNLDLFAKWQEDALMHAASQEPEAFRDEQVVAAHEALRPALIDALVAAGIPEREADPYSSLLDSAIHSAARLILEGQDRAAVGRALARFLP